MLVAAVLMRFVQDTAAKTAPVGVGGGH